MGALCFLIALVCFVVETFGGRIGSLNLIAFGLAWMAAGHLLGGGVVNWIKARVND